MYSLWLCSSCSCRCLAAGPGYTEMGKSNAHKEDFSCWFIRISVGAFANIWAAYVPFVLTVISVTLL